MVRDEFLFHIHITQAQLTLLLLKPQLPIFPNTPKVSSHTVISHHQPHTTQAQLHPPTIMTSPSPTSPQDFGYPLILEDYTTVPLPTTSPTLCATCHTPTPTKCSACKNIRYCTPTCQTLDWPLHKTICKRYTSSLSHSLSDKKSHRRILFFGADNTKPQFAYLSFTDSETTQRQLCSFFFPSAPHQDLKKLSFHNRYLPYFVQLTYDTNPHGTRALSENKGLGVPFRGPVVVMVFDPVEGVSGQPLDVDTTVLGALMGYVGLWREYRGPVFVEVCE